MPGTVTFTTNLTEKQRTATCSGNLDQVAAIADLKLREPHETDEDCLQNLLFVLEGSFLSTKAFHEFISFYSHLFTIQAMHPLDRGLFLFHMLSP